MSQLQHQVQFATPKFHIACSFSFACIWLFSDYVEYLTDSTMWAFIGMVFMPLTCISIIYLLHVYPTFGLWQVMPIVMCIIVDYGSFMMKSKEVKQ